MSLIARLKTVMGWTMCSRLLGLLRDRLLATTFGASTTLDAFMIAFSLPNLLRQLFGEGTLSAAFVPRYIRLREGAGTADDSGEAFAGLVLTRLTIILSLIAALGMVAAAIFMWYGAPRNALVATLAFAQIPYLIFICLAAVMAGMLNARSDYGIPSASPIILNVCLIGAVLLFPEIGILPYAVLAAGILQLALHVYGLLRSGGMPPLRLKSSEHLRDLRTAWLPTLIGSGAQQLNVFLDGMIAYIMLSHRPGAVTVLYMANRLLQLPMALISGGVGTALYPDLSRAAALGWPQAGEVLRRGTALVTALLLPAAVGLWLCAEPLVGVIYQSGAFTADDAARTVFVTQFLALALLPLGFTKLLVKALNAGLEQRKPMYIAVFSVVLNVILNIILVQTTLYEAGLALASLISGSVACLLAALCLMQKGSGAVVEWRRLVRPTAASALMGLAVYVLLKEWPSPETASTSLQAARLAAAVFLGIAVYALAMGRKGYQGLKG